MQSGEWIVIDGRKYQLDIILSTGVGSYGQVWAAMDNAGHEVALKFINAEMMAQADPSLRGHWRAHLEREIAFLAGLDPDQARHVVALIDHGQVEGQPVLVMERMAANLGHWLAQQQRNNAPPPDLERILDWAGQILAGLDIIHNAGFVYRDLKFSNILVDERGAHLKLADFGSLKRENGDSTRSFIGTPATMAPEQALPVRFGPEGNEYVVDYRADYYALGLLLFSLFTRQSATAAQRRLGQLLAQHGQEGAARHGEELGGLNDEERDLLRRSIEFWTIPVLTLPGGSPAARLTGFINRMLARAPDERPQNSAEIHAVLKSVRSSQIDAPTRAPGTPPIEPDWDLPSPPTQPPNRQRRQSSKASRSRWPRRAAALVGVMALTGALAWAIVIPPGSNLPPERLDPPDAVMTTAPETAATPSEPAAIEPAPETAATPSEPVAIEPAPETAATPSEPAATEPAPEVVATDPEPATIEPVTVEAEKPPTALPPSLPVAKPEPKRLTPPMHRPVAKPVARPLTAPLSATPSVAKPEPKPPAARKPEISRKTPLRTVKTTPTPVPNKPVTPTSRPVVPVSAHPHPVARAEPRTKPVTPDLPPIRLESRPKPAVPDLPPIQLESRPQPRPATLPPI
ncbi:MAG: Non-specific serine/threonine protein kinase, partial [Pseudomonadota bacterium]|nr:Non-specific serine/threonine protein kinase [Pseudomonadota bacterium]